MSFYLPADLRMHSLALSSTLTLGSYFQFRWGGVEPGHYWLTVPAPVMMDDDECEMGRRGTEVFGENLPQCRLADHKSHMI
jgi:hypothetical protein